MATEDLCLVCTDSLDYTGVGPCGHKEACSRCVARLRFVMEDTRCMLCKQDNPAVLFTRYMGDYTQSLPPGEFNKLQERTQAGELYCLSEVNGYFDDKEHFNTIKSLCSFTHPLVNGVTFNNLNALKRKLLEQHKLHFCDICIKSRKVFISEQVLYSKADLERHYRTGDDAGPLAESGFKGHPICRFCKKRFYDGDELYRHMENSHEHCFLCRKLHPHRFVYYKDYDELDGHFQSDHHPCPHPSCLERKFVVFAEEQDLRRHFATEHGSEMNMSRAQRRQAMSLNIQLTYSSREEEAAAAAAAAALHRPGVVIGGGHNLPPRGGRGGRGGAMRHSHSEGAMAQALQASVDSSRAEQAARGAAAAAGPSSVTFSAEDFPSVSGQGMSGTAPLGTWVGAGSGPGGGPSLRQEDFPALPTTSKNQRRRQREKERTLAARLGAAAAPIRVVNRATAPTPAEAAAAAAAAGGSSSSRAGGAGSSSSSSSFRHSQSAGNLVAAAGASSGAASAAASDDDEEESGGVGGFESDNAPAASGDHFPALPGAPSSSSAAAAAATQAHPAWVPVRRSGRPPKPGQAGSKSSSSTPVAKPNSIADFPSLAATIPASSSRGAAGRGAASSSSSSSTKAGSSRGGSSSSSSGGVQPVQTVAEAVAAAGGVSEQLKAANKALIERCKAALSEEGFRDFRERSAGFMQGGLSPAAYHKHVVQLGLLQLVPQLAALCPDADKRTALVTAHRQYLQSAQDTMQAPPAGAANARGWVPPEAAMAALAEVEQQGSWSCERCTLINAPSSRSCEVCSAPKPKGGVAAGGGAAAAGSSGGSSSKSRAAAAASSSARAAPAGAAGGSSSSWSAAAAAGSSGGSSSGGGRAAQQQQADVQQQQQQAPPPGESWPGLPGGKGKKGGSKPPAAASAPAPQQQEQPASSSAAASSGSSSPPQQQQGGKKKKGGNKQPLSELLATGKSHPQNAWSQQQRLSQLAAPSGGRGSMGQWGKQGGSKLAKSINAFNDAYGDKQ